MLISFVYDSGLINIPIVIQLNTKVHKINQTFNANIRWNENERGFIIAAVSKWNLVAEINKPAPHHRFLLLPPTSLLFPVYWVRFRIQQSGLRTVRHMAFDCLWYSCCLFLNESQLTRKVYKLGIKTIILDLLVYEIYVFNVPSVTMRSIFSLSENADVVKCQQRWGCFCFELCTK